MSEYRVETALTVAAELGQNPSVCATANGDLLALRLDLTDCMAGCTMFLHRSEDGGQTWSDPELTIRSELDLGGVEGSISSVDGGASCFIAYMEGSNLKREPRNPRVFKVMRSTDGGRTWSKPRLLHGDWGAAHPYGKIVQLEESEELLLPAYERAAHSGWRASQAAIHVLSSMDGGISWQLKGSVRKDPTIEGRNPSETDLIELSDGRLLAVSRMDPDQPGNDAFGGWALSQDRGATWSDLATMNIEICEPRLLLAGDRVLLLARSWPGDLERYSRPLQGAELEPGIAPSNIGDVRRGTPRGSPVVAFGVFLFEMGDSPATWNPVLQVEDPRGPAPQLAESQRFQHAYQAGYGDIVELGGGKGGSGDADGGEHQRYLALFRQGDPRMADRRPGAPGSDQRAYWHAGRTHLFQRYVAANIITGP